MAGRGGRRRPALTHLDDGGRLRMVDVSSKPVTVRRAVAEARVRLSPATLRLARSGRSAKGDLRAVVSVAAIQAAKRTADLIPLCHPLPLDHVEVALEFHTRGVTIRTETVTSGRTGVEMEAMTAAAAGALALYDMLKGVERGITIEQVRLVVKEGGRSGRWKRRGTA